VLSERRTMTGRELDDALGGFPWRGRPIRRVLRLVPLVFVLPPLATFVLANPPAELLASLVPAVAVFVAIVLWMVLGSLETLPRRAAVATILLTLLAILVALLDPASHWLILFFYPAVAAGLLSSVRTASIAIVTVAVIAAVVGWPILADPANRLLRPLEWALAGFATLAITRLVIVYDQLAAARAEVGRLAAADERLRIARDLHDLIGHGLSLITLKAELAGRLLPVDAGLAAVEITDIESVSRRALEDVRAVVGGFRRLTLEGELVGARAALEAAGVTIEIDHAAAGLPGEIDEAFAWCVREGATNVIRHAHARTATIRTRREDGTASLEILNDGPGSANGVSPGDEPGAHVPTRTGSGLMGLAERARAVSGRIEAAPSPDGGYRLAMVIPLDGGHP
jgi:two-component system sensor histidine kinase DesK